MSEGNEFQEAMKKFSNGKGPSFKGVFFAIALIGVAWGVFSSYYTVNPQEEAVVMRLGKHIGTYPPGLHFKLPFGIDKMYIIETTVIHQEEFGFRTDKIKNTRTRYSQKSYDNESLMLTGDLNVADVEWVVQYKISDAYKFLTQARNPRQNIRDISESIMRRVVGDRTVDEVLTTGRQEVSAEADRLMQEVLDKYDFGVQVVTVKLQDVNPPESVKPSFNEVNEARQEQDKLKNEAQRAYNKVIPESRGKAEELVANAEGYATALVARAEGDASNFQSIFREYRRAPKITKRRIYIETMEELLGRFESLTIVDSKVKGLLPIFNNSQDGSKL